MENTNTQRKVISISRKKFNVAVLIVVAIVFVVLYLGAQVVRNSTGIAGDAVGYRNNGGTAVAPSMPMPPMYDGMYNEKYPYPQNDPSYKDTREFLKTNYSANIETRDVSDIVRDVKGAVREAEGRIDGTSTSEEYGYVSFVVPKTNYDAFKDEVESLVHKKLIAVSETSTNMLGQKQAIEQRGESIAGSLDELTKAKAALTAKHNQAIAAINADIAVHQNTLLMVKNQMATATSDTEKATLRNSETNYTNQLAELEQRKQAENKNYTAESNAYAAKIAEAKKAQDGNVKQDEQFTDNIETVNGYVSVHRASLWEMARIFSPIHPTIIVIVLLLVLLYWLNKKSYIPKIVLV